MTHAMQKSPLDFVVSSVERKGGKGGCKLVLVKTGITLEKHNPLFPPLLRGTNLRHEF